MPGDVELCRAPLCIMYVLYRSVSNSHARTHSLTHDTIQYVEYVAPKQPQAGGLRINQEGGGRGAQRQRSRRQTEQQQQHEGECPSGDHDRTSSPSKTPADTH